MNRKIFFVCSEFPPGPGGIGNHGFNLIHTLQRKGYDTFTLTNLENATPEEAQKFAASKGLKVKYIPRSKWIQLSRMWACVVACFKYKPDIIIASGMFSLWLARLLKKLYPNAEYLAVIHGSEADRKVSWQRHMTEKSYLVFDHLVAVSNYTASFIKSAGKLPPITIIPNAVDIRFLKAFEQGSFVKLPGNPAILTVGNVTPRKGQHNMIKALPWLKKRFPDIHYHCVGLKSFASQNEELASSLGVNEHVTFHGKLPLKSLMSSYRGCDIFAMTSEHQADGDFEGFGIAILEANFFGKPAIGSRGCGIEDAIHEGENGYKVDAHDPATIVEAVSKCLNEYDRLSAGARQWSAAHDWDLIAEKYIKLFV